MQPGPDGIRIVVSNQLEALAAQLATALCEAPAPPLAAERIVVPQPLLGRWLRLQLATELDVAAHLRIELPAEFAWSMMRDAVPALPAAQPFAPRVLRWRLFTVLADWQGEDALKRYLADGDERKRFELADRLAAFYDRCLLYRGDWIRAWEAGDAPHWQARLWQALRGAAPGPGHWIDAVDAYRAAADTEAQLALPLSTAESDVHAPTSVQPQVAFFGVAALSPSYLQLLRAATPRWNICLYLLSPCREYWADVPGRRARRADGDEAADGNELLAAWGRPAREMQHLLAEELGTGAPAEIYAAPTGQTRLAAVQRDILDFRRATQARDVDAADDEDDSLQIHACHSPMREAEVLHDRLLGLFEARPDLQPADVLILTPSLDDYAPAIDAVFGAAGRIPFHIGRQRRRDSAAVQALLHLLALPGSRYGMGSVLAPLLCSAVQRRFRLADADLPLLRTALARAGVRWGIDAAHVGAQGLPATSSHTWRHGLRRLLLGYALAAETADAAEVPLFAGVAPCELSPWGEQADLAAYERLGALADYCEQAFALETWDEARTAGQWTEALRGLVATFFDADDAEVDAVSRLIEDFAAEADPADAAIPFAVMRDALAGRAGEVTRAVPRLADGTTVARLGFGEVLPAQVVCVVGMNDRAFPRHVAGASFDLIAAEPRRGDRDRRDEDRYAFLDALLAARRCFLVSYLGRDLRDNAVLPPSVVVAELAEYLQARFPNRPPQPCQHPLQAFSPRYFAAGDSDALFSYSSAMAAAATALAAAAPSAAVPDRFGGKVPVARAHGVADAEESLNLRELMRFAAGPVRYFMTRRLGLALPAGDDEAAEDEPLEVRGLDAWLLKRDLFALQRAKVPAEAAAGVLGARALLPNGSLGAVEHGRRSEQVSALVDAIEAFSPLDEELLEVDIDVAGTRLVGRPLAASRYGAMQILRVADGLVCYRFGAIRPQDIVAAWLRLLALTCATGEAAAVRLFGLDEPRFRNQRPLAERQLRGPGPSEAAAALGEWVAAWRRGQAEPLPFFPGTSLGWAEGGSQRALQSWRGDAGEGREPFNRLVFPAGPFSEAFEELADDLLRPLAMASA